MKQRIRLGLPVMSLVLLFAVNAFGQDQTVTVKRTSPVDGQAQVDITRAIGTQFSFETRVVKGAPYSATAEAETVQMLTDGNRIRNKTTTTIYRDSEGRTRREMTGRTGSADVFISDPPSGFSYSLHPQQRLAIKSTANVPLRIAEEQKRVVERAIKEKAQTADVTVTTTANGEVLRRDQLTREQRALVEKRAVEEKLANVSTQGEMKAGAAGDEKRLVKRAALTESLGEQVIEGVRCEGVRRTVTIPANSIGNDLPINIVSEDWFSPELQVLVLTKHNDPRSGETVYRLTNINRTEPDRTLFEIPADFTVREYSVTARPKSVKEE